jgi:predicted ATP-dependent endonuclease of OLD family
MSIKAIRIHNLLSFSDINISNIEDVNCVIGKNNVGKSNVLKCLRYFYEKLDGKKVVPLELNSKYSSTGYITITYDANRIKSIVKRARASESKFLTHIWKSFFSDNDTSFASAEGEISLTLNINSDDSVRWSIKSKEKREIIKYLYPFFYIETRHIDLYDWDLLWHLVGTVKPIGSNVVNRDDLVIHLNSKISKNNNSYMNHVNLIQQITDTKNYTKKEKFLNYIKIGLEGQTFHVEGNDIRTQSDGTNSHKFILLFLKLLISLTRTSYIHPFVYIDEPEVGLHPKKNEDLITEVHDTYVKYKSTSKDVFVGKYKTPNPKIFFATHSPNILKQIVRLFGNDQQVLHFSKHNDVTVIKKMNSQYDDSRFINVFSDNEARLFFSSFIFFVEGSTELELFRNKSLQNVY